MGDAPAPAELADGVLLDAASGFIPEIRAHCATPAARDVPIGEPVEFDYKGRGYHLEPPR
jgi:hypothetical protein